MVPPVLPLCAPHEVGCCPCTFPTAPSRRSSGAVSTLFQQGVALPAGPGVTQWFNLSDAVNGNTTVVVATVTDSAGAVVCNNLIPFTTPQVRQ